MSLLNTSAWFKPREKEETNPQATTVQEPDRDAPFEEYSEKINGLDDIAVKLGLHNRVSACHQYLYEMGRMDGALGVTLPHLPDIARATAHALLRHINVILTGRIGALNAELHAAQTVVQNDENVYKKEQAYCDYVQYQHKFFPRNHSYLLSVIYFVCGLALVIADIPLALELLQKGFSFPAPPEDLSFVHLFEKGMFWNVIAANWETVITALGIALCTVYIKIYYDEFVGTPYGHKAIAFNKFIDENNFDHSGVKSEKLFKNSIKTAIVIITVAAILFLALFRLKTAAKSNDIDVNFFSGAAFVSITLLFPIVGGICLSYAFNNFQNRMRLSGAAKKCAASRKDFLQAVKDFAKIKKDHEDVVAAAAKFNDEEHIISEYQSYLIAFYRRGYAIGGMRPEKHSKGEDLYAKILEWRNTAISRKVNHNIHNIN